MISARWAGSTSTRCLSLNRPSIGLPMPLPADGGVRVLMSTPPWVVNSGLSREMERPFSAIPQEEHFSLPSSK
ncbi:hypothetical protein D3C87_2070210 [compost metagenome]